MPVEDDAELPLVAADELKPYCSLMILRSTGQNHQLAVQTLANQMSRAARTTRGGGRSDIVASGLSGASGYVRAGGDSDGIDEVWAFVYRKIDEPAWSVDSSVFTDTTYQLGVIVRRNDLIAAHCPGALRRSLQKWLDRPPRPQLERVESAILNGAFLTGEAKGLWLRGAQSPMAARPDSKQISGRQVQDSLNPFEDGGYALSSARAAFAGPPQKALSGTVGTTPRDSIVWNRSTVGFAEFVALVTDVLKLVEDIEAAGTGVDKPYPVLAERVTSLVGVSGAFDIVVSSADSLPVGPDFDEEMASALALLETATLEVEPILGSADFRLVVGLEGGMAGTLLCALVEHRGTFALKIGFDPARSATNPVAVREILDAVLTSSDQISVYYESGHVFNGRDIWRRQIHTGPFPNWMFEDFTGYDILREKPLDGSASDIHAAIARDGDTSLFAWVVARYSEGWLICDDGSGEVADFVHIARNGDLVILHVKAAGRGRRLPSVGAYQEVVTQATKNLSYIDRDALYERLISSTLDAPACWADGQRVADRSEFLEQLHNRRRGKTYVVVVQPHVSQSMYERIEAPGGSAGATNAYRLMLLETVLNASRSAVTGLGADLQVIGGLT